MDNFKSSFDNIIQERDELLRAAERVCASVYRMRLGTVVYDAALEDLGEVVKRIKKTNEPRDRTPFDPHGWAVE